MPARLQQWGGVSAWIRSDGLTACFIALMSGLAQVTGIALLLFPELAALSFDVFRRPHGAWARAPVLLVATPFLTGLAGTIIARNLPYGPSAVLLAVASAIVIVQVLRSPIVPALAAGLLPLTIGLDSWWYAPSLLFGTSMLVCISILWQRLCPLPAEAPIPAPAGKRDERDLSWLLFFGGFLIMAACIAAATEVRFFLLPPLVVVAFEMFAHFEKCPWVKRPLRIPMVCGLSALATLTMVTWLGTGPFAVVLSLLAATVIMRIFDMYFPPAIAVAILPFVMPHHDFSYPAVVTASALLLSFTFLLWRSMVLRRQGSSATRQA